MKYYDFQLNIPCHLLTTDVPDLFVHVTYGVSNGKVLVIDLALCPGLGKCIRDWDLLETLAQDRAEQREIGKGNESLVQELENVMK